MRKRTKNTRSMRANQESWFRSDHGKIERERERGSVRSGFSKNKRK